MLRWRLFDLEPKNHITLYVWSRIGCAINCQFCYTAKIGLKGILSTTGIIEQLVIAARMCNQELGLGVVTNVMFMDMGEPFQNIHNMITTHFGLFYIEQFIIMDSDGKYCCCHRQQQYLPSESMTTN